MFVLALYSAAGIGREENSFDLQLKEGAGKISKIPEKFWDLLTSVGEGEYSATKKYGCRILGEERELKGQMALREEKVELMRRKYLPGEFP